jgi:hypothetical protein
MLFGLLALTTAAVRADIILNFNSPDYVTTTGITLNDWSSSGASFSVTTPRSPAPGVYSGPTFYGGGTVLASVGSGTFATYVLANNQTGAGGDDPIRLATSWSGTSGPNQVKFYGLFLFKQADWLTLNSGNVELDSVNALTVSGFRASSHAADGGVRFVIEKSGAYYVTSLNPVSTTYGAVSLSNPASGSWFNYDPATSMSTIGSSASLSAFDHLTTVGFLVELGSTGASGTSANTLWSDFVVNATVVPEPSVAALALLGIGLFVLRQRR